MWIVLALISSVFLSIYDLFKKFSLKNNAIQPVLFFASLTSAIIFGVIFLVSRFSGIGESFPLYIPEISSKSHFLLIIKTIIVGSSWMFAYAAVKHLPLSIVAPIRSTAPIWTLIGAVLIFHEHLSVYQLLGILITVLFLYRFSVAGKKEGINFRGDIGILYIFLATLIGSISSLYDKFLVTEVNRMALQAWFAFYMVPFTLLLVAFIWYPNRKERPFKFHWAIPLIGVCLSIADFAYFYALSYSDAYISIVSVLRRSSVVLTFTLAAIVLHENNIKAKALALAGIVGGILLVIFASK